MDGGYQLYRVSAITPFLAALWAQLVIARLERDRAKYGGDQADCDERWINRVQPNDATIDHVLRFCCGQHHEVPEPIAQPCCLHGRWASLLTDPNVFVEPMLRLSYGDNTPEDYGLGLLHKSITNTRRFPRPVVEEETWT